MRIHRFLEESAVYRIHSAHRQLTLSLAATLSQVGLNFDQALVLVAIAQEKAATHPSDLAKAFRRSKSQISHAVAHLESIHFIRRATDESDARKYRLQLCDGKKALVRRVINSIERAERMAERMIQKELRRK